MIVPYLHVARLSDLPLETCHEMDVLLRCSEQSLYKLYQCDGINIGMNQGKAGGAGIDEHLHWHILPRWSGDSNFMTVVAGERVIPEAFERTYQLLYDALRNNMPERE